MVRVFSNRKGHKVFARLVFSKPQSTLRLRQARKGGKTFGHWLLLRCLCAHCGSDFLEPLSSPRLRQSRVGGHHKTHFPLEPVRLQEDSDQKTFSQLAVRAGDPVPVHQTLVSIMRQFLKVRMKDFQFTESEKTSAPHSKGGIGRGSASAVFSYKYIVCKAWEVLQNAWHVFCALGSGSTG